MVGIFDDSCTELMNLFDTNLEGFHWLFMDHIGLLSDRGFSLIFSCFKLGFALVFVWISWLFFRIRIGDFMAI